MLETLVGLKWSLDQPLSRVSSFFDSSQGLLCLIQAPIIRVRNFVYGSRTVFFRDYILQTEKVFSNVRGFRNRESGLRFFFPLWQLFLDRHQKCGIKVRMDDKSIVNINKIYYYKKNSNTCIFYKYKNRICYLTFFLPLLPPSI